MVKWDEVEALELMRQVKVVRVGADNQSSRENTQRQKVKQDITRGE